MTLPINQCNEAKLFRSIANLLKNDPDLDRVGTFFNVWDGSDSDILVPTRANLPYLALTPGAGKSEPFTIDQSTSPLTLNILSITKGTDFEDALNYWSLIRKVLFPGDNSVQALLQSVNAVAQPFLTIQNATTKSIEEARCIELEGAITIKFRVNTRA
jgi:hypothetical protein